MMKKPVASKVLAGAAGGGPAVMLGVILAHYLGMPTEVAAAVSGLITWAVTLMFAYLQPEKRY